MTAKASYLVIVLALLIYCTAHSQESIKIGAIYSITGEAQAISDEHLISARFAIKEINSNGGILGKQIELIEFDNKSTGLGSRNAATQAVDAKVVAVLGPSWSSHALATAPLLQKAGIPMLTPTATNPQVTLVGDYIFRICFIDSFQGIALAQFAHKDLKARRVIILVNTGYVYSTDLADMFTVSFTERGGVIVRSIDYSEENTNYERMLLEMKDLDYDIIFIPGYTRDSAQIIKTAADIGITTTFIGGDGWSHLMFDYGGSSINNNYYLTHWAKSLDNAKSLKFVKKIDDIFEYDKINAGMALSYDTVYLLADAITRANSTRPDKIRDALAATQSFSGVTGNIQFDENRNPIKPAVIQQFRDNTSFVIKRVLPDNAQ